MPAPVLLVADDLSTIAAVKRVLARESYEVVLATSAADGIIAWGHHLPALVLLQPSVESDRGGVVLEELQSNPEARLLRVVLLGETIPGFAYPVESLPIEADHFAQTVAENVRASEAHDSWHVVEGHGPPPEPPALVPIEPEAWRATGHDADEVPPEMRPTDRRAATLEAEFFGELEDELARDVEQQALASVDSTLAAQSDAELQRLEDEVLAEARRRRALRDPAAGASPPPPTAPEPPGATGLPPDEADFGDSGSDDAEPETSTERWAAAPAATGVGGATEVQNLLERAEVMLFESRAAAEAGRRAEAEEARRVEAELDGTRRRAEEAEAATVREREARAAVESELEDARAHHDAQRDELAGSRAELVQLGDAFASSQQAAALTQEQLEAERTARGEVERVNEEQQAALVEAQASLERLESESRALAVALEARTDTVARLEQALTDARSTAEELSQRLEAERTARAGSEARVTEMTAAHAETTAERDAARAEALALSEQRAALERQLEELRTQTATARNELEATRARADETEALAQLASARVQELERRATLPLNLPGRKPLGVPRHGSVTLEQLAHLTSELVLAEATVKLELVGPGGMRTLWFRRGHLVAAESAVSQESLIDRARRDGLIDARQDNDFRLLKTATPAEQLAALKSRGCIRDSEAVPLVQRSTEQIALEALSEAASQYRISDEAPSSGVLAAAVPRPTLPLLAEALRRALPADQLLELLGGSAAVPTPRDTEIDVRQLGFSERARKMLTWVNGEATVEDLAMASGLRQEEAWRTLLVARHLDLISVVPPAVAPAQPSTDLDLRRLVAKFDEVQEADYFTILSLPRTATTDDVQRAFSRLSDEFDPIKYAGHPDPVLEQRARAIHSLLEEAARALADDHRRSEYARHLLE